MMKNRLFRKLFKKPIHSEERLMDEMNMSTMNEELEEIDQPMTQQIEEATELYDVGDMETVAEIEESTVEEVEEKESRTNYKKSVCDYFGYNETSTEKWVIALMKIWHKIMTAIWILIGMITFAPVAFIASKLSVIVKRAWCAWVLAIVIYMLVALFPVWVQHFASLYGGC